MVIHGVLILKISIDSNCFKNLTFIDFLINNSSKIEIHVPIIVYIETLIWYKFKGLTLKDFSAELNDLHAKIDLIDEKIGDLLSSIVVQKDKSFPFKIHARDYFIGVTADYNKTNLITYNIKHFDWLQIKAMTPEELVEDFINLP